MNGNVEINRSRMSQKKKGNSECFFYLFWYFKKAKQRKWHSNERINLDLGWVLMSVNDVDGAGREEEVDYIERG